jgi:hypothetical protein
MLTAIRRASSPLPFFPVRPDVGADHAAQRLVATTVAYHWLRTPRADDGGAAVKS